MIKNINKLKAFTKVYKYVPRTVRLTSPNVIYINTLILRIVIFYSQI
jgi:hypothetical protein